MRTKLPTKTRRVVEINHVQAGLQIRKLRESKGKSLRWLAKELDRSPPFVSDLERGRRNWLPATYQKALDILNGGAK